MKIPNFTALQVGDMLPPLELPPIDQAVLALFAEAANAQHPMHIDDTGFASEDVAPEVFAHGMLSMSYLGRLLTCWVDQRKVRQFNARFTGITELGHHLTCTGRVVEKYESECEQRMNLEIQTANEYGEVKIVGEAIIAL